MAPRAILSIFQDGGETESKWADLMKSHILVLKVSEREAASAPEAALESQGVIKICVY